MSYIGNTPTNQNFVAGSDQFNGTGSQTVFTLSRNVNTVNDIQVVVSNVPQDPFTAYSVAGNSLTFTSAPPAGTGNVYVVYRATNVQTFVPSPGATVGGSFGIQGNLNFYGTGNRITGDFSNATLANRVMFQSSTTNGQTSIGVLPNGTGGISSVNLFGTTDPANASLGQLATTTTEVRLQSGITGTGTYLPMTFYTGGSERMRVDTSGNVGIGTSSPAGSMQLLRSSDPQFIITDDQSSSFSFGTTTGYSAIGTDAAAMIFKTGVTTGSLYSTGTERARIDSSGNLQMSTAGTKVLNSSGRPILNQTGSILQVAQGFKTDTFSTNSTSLQDVSGLSVTLTPASSSSKFLIMVNMTYLNTFYVGPVALLRNGTQIGLADAAGSRPRSFLYYSNSTNLAGDGQWVRESMDYLDSPATASAITYKIQASARADGQGGVMYINRSYLDRDTVSYDPRGVSSIVVMEIAG